ncbi:MAG: helix-turn-helix transcriptional regulator [bacterium]|nr:helix-turn-helix transcriptional regulator [bacterium]
MLSVGEILKKERERQGLSLKQVEKEIRVREKVLATIEANDWTLFSSKIYIVGILKNYSSYLKLDSDRITAFFRRDYERIDDITFKKGISKNYLNPETKKFVISGIVLLFLLFFLYFGYQLKLYFSPPLVTIVSPVTSTFRSIEQIKIVGKTEKEASVMIFGERVYQNKEGIFEYVLPLKKGKNELNIEVTGANGKKTILQKQFILE